LANSQFNIKHSVSARPAKHQGYATAVWNLEAASKWPGSRAAHKSLRQ